jgi:hypothetical protein
MATPIKTQMRRLPRLAVLGVALLVLSGCYYAVPVYGPRGGFQGYTYVPAYPGPYYGTPYATPTYGSPYYGAPYATAGYPAYVYGH